MTPLGAFRWACAGGSIAFALSTTYTAVAFRSDAIGNMAGANWAIAAIVTGLNLWLDFLRGGGDKGNDE